MFSSGPKYQKLITNLRLAINRLKLLEKKKTELAVKARKEISDYLAANKEDRARIRVEHIIREDYYVEAMEIMEMFCDLLLARMGLIQSQKELDPGLVEPITSILWATPRLQADVQELKIVSEQLTLKYGKEFTLSCLANTEENVNEKLMHKLSVQAPPKVLVEKYLEEIARTYNVPFVPDPQVMVADEMGHAEDLLIDFGGERKNNSGGGRGGGGGGGGTAVTSHIPANLAYPPQGNQPGYVYPPQQQNCMNPPVPGYNELYNNASVPPAVPAGQNLPPPVPGVPPKGVDDLPELPELPSVPGNSISGGPDTGSESVDFDDLTKRFEDLKKRK